MSGVAELVTLPEVQTAVAAEPRVLLDLWGTWCAPCRALRPILEELAGSRSDWSFVAANIEDVPGVAETFDVSATPTLLLFEDGVEVARIGGMVMPADLAERLDRVG